MIRATNAHEGRLTWQYFELTDYDNELDDWPVDEQGRPVLSRAGILLGVVDPIAPDLSWQDSFQERDDEREVTRVLPLKDVVPEGSYIITGESSYGKWETEVPTTRSELPDDAVLLAEHREGGEWDQISFKPLGASEFLDVSITLPDGRKIGTVLIPAADKAEAQALLDCVFEPGTAIVH